MATVMALFIDPKATFDSIILLILFGLYLIVAIIIVTIAVSLIIQDKTFSLFVVFCILCGSWVIITSIFNWGFYELLWYDIIGDEYHTIMIVLSKGEGVIERLKKFNVILTCNIIYSAILLYWYRAVNNI